jgi:exodeoxyribonuclease-3
MRIVSWNVNGLRALAKKGQFDWLLKTSPDIFCLQETKTTAEQLSEEIRNPAGYFSYFDHSRGRKGYSGVAIYTKIKPESVEYALGVSKKPELDLEGRFIALHFKDFTLCNIYFPNGGGGPARLKFKFEYYDAFLDYIEKLRKQDKHIIFCGDINTAHEEIDLARPKENEKNTGFLPEERAWLDEVVNHGYIDVFRHLYPNKTEAYTYWDMKTFSRERNVGWRIDYFFVSSDVLSRIKKIEILSKVYGSDHCPLLLELK